MTARTGIPGADELVGSGVYLGMPDDVPHPVRDRHVVVVGEAAECAAAARRLGEAGWMVTVVTRQCCCGSIRGCRRKAGSEVVCATGIRYLEALVLRRIETGRIDACNASMLVLLSGY